jgi:hypothetical protein
LKAPAAQAVVRAHSSEELELPFEQFSSRLEEARICASRIVDSRAAARDPQRIALDAPSRRPDVPLKSMAPANSRRSIDPHALSVRGDTCCLLCEPAIAIRDNIPAS